MRRAIAAVACGLTVLGGVGCQNFSYVQRDAQGGVIELKASEKEAALAKLAQEEGEIEIENIVPKGKPGGQFDPAAAVRPSERMAATSGFGSLMASRDDDKVQIKYRKKSPAGVTPPGLPPADDGLKAAGYQTTSTYNRPPAGAAPTGTGLPTPDMTGLGGK